MTRPPRITIKNHRNHSVTVSGFSYQDLRLIARAIEEGSYTGGDRGGPVSQSLLRIARALAVPAMFPDQHAPVVISGGRFDGDDNYHEDVDRPDLFDADLPVRAADLRPRAEDR